MTMRKEEQEAQRMRTDLRVMEGLVGGGRRFAGSEGSEMRSGLWGLLLLQPVLAVRGPE